MQNQIEAPHLSMKRNAVGATGQDRVVGITEVFPITGMLPPMVSVATHLDLTPFSPDERIRLERYAEIPELALGMPYVIVGDRKSARFRDFRSVSAEPGENPYRTFRRSIQDAFGRGWEKFEEEIEAHHPGMLTAIRDRYQKLLDRDATSHHTGIPIGVDSFKKGVELGPETAYFALGVGLAIANSREAVPSLKEATATKEQRLDLAMSLSRILRARAFVNLTETFWTKRKVHTFADWDSLRLIQNASGKYTFNSDNELFSTYNPETDPPLSDPTITCMALLFKMRPTDRTNALENAITAAVIIAGELDLFNPDIAKAAWEQRGKLLQNRLFKASPEEILIGPTIGSVIERLPEDLTQVREDKEFNALFPIFSGMFI